MKRTIIMVLVAMISCTAIQAKKKQANSTEAQTVSSVRKVSNFTKIASTGSFDVVFTQGNTTSVKVVGDADDVNRISTTVENGTLKIATKSRGKYTSNFFFGKSRGETTIYITSPDLIEVTIKGSGDFKSKGKIDSDNLSINLIGSGDADIKYIICDNLNLNVRGSGDTEIDYLRCATSSICVQGSGDVSVKEDRVNNTNLAVYGSGDIELVANGCGNINASVSGSGDITLSGSARNLNKSVRGSGDISSSRLRIK